MIQPQTDQSLAKYRAFVTTAQTGSFTKTAAQMGYTQSGISRMVAALESELGVRLFERQHGLVKLTPEGASLLPSANDLCRDASALQERAQALQGVVVGTIRIGTFTSVATYWLPQVIAGFRADHPGIQYQLQLGDYTEIEQWVSDGTVDCGFVRLPTKRGLCTSALAKDQFMAVVPENHELADAPSFPLSRFAREPFIELASATDSEVAFMFAQQGLELHPVFSTWDDYAIMAMVEAGLGLAILPSLVLSRSPFHIKALPLDPPAHRSIGIATRAGATSPATSRFLEYLDLRDKPLGPPAS